MILGSQTPDYRFGGLPEDLEPRFKDEPPQLPPVKLGPYKLRWQQMRLEYMSKYYQHHRDLSRFINPSRGFFEGFVPNYNQQIDDRLIVDGDPAQDARILAAGMSSGLTSPSRPWFKLATGTPELDEREDVKVWLDLVERLMYKIYRRGGFYGAAQSVYEELGIFGTAGMGVFENFDTVARFRPYTVGEYFFACDQHGKVNAFGRQVWKTVDQVVTEFGWKNCSTQVQNAYKTGNRDTWVLLYELTEPNSTKNPQSFDFEGKAYRCLVWEAVAPDDKALSMQGYNEFPIMGPRWDTTTSADIYGRGPGWYARGDIKMLYRMQKDSLLAINKVADPPVLLDSSIEGVANMLPGGITRSSSATPNAGARPAYQIQPDIEAIEMKIGKVKQAIASRFYADLFMMMINSPDQDRTAREIVERHEEKLLMLGPVLERIESEFLNPCIDRTFAIAFRAGLIPPPPKIIAGMPLKVEYISLLAQAQKMVGTASIEQESAFVGSIIGAYPEAKDVFDPDRAIRAHAEMIGVPPRIIRSEQEVAAIREARQKQAEAMKAQQDAMAAVSAAKTLSDTAVGGGNALSHILGVGGETPGEGAPTPGGTA